MRTIFDLDGTLADITHRLHYISGGDRKDWDGFFDACDDDKPILPIIRLLKVLSSTGHHVHIWSGRSEKVRHKTIAWLRGQGIFLNSPGKVWTGTSLDMTGTVEELRLRPEGDYRSDDILKREWLDEAKEQGKGPVLVFEDRGRVVDMWREQGIFCCQVAPGTF